LGQDNGGRIAMAEYITGQLEKDRTTVAGIQERTARTRQEQLGQNNQHRTNTDDNHDGQP
jgi:hypothetical protein